MNRDEMIAALDQEIARLEEVRRVLRGSRDVTAGLSAVRNGSGAGAKRRISPEGRRRIIEAQRRRWAKQKKENSGKSK